jgi:hypothetical protein
MYRPCVPVIVGQRTHLPSNLQRFCTCVNITIINIINGISQLNYTVRNMNNKVAGNYVAAFGSAKANYMYTSEAIYTIK